MREVLHAGILLDLVAGMSDGAAASSNGVNRHTVALCAIDSTASRGSRHPQRCCSGQVAEHQNARRSAPGAREEGSIRLDGNLLSTAGIDGTIRLLDVDVNSWIKRLFGLAKLNLPLDQWREGSTAPASPNSAHARPAAWRRPQGSVGRTALPGLYSGPTRVSKRNVQPEEPGTDPEGLHAITVTFARNNWRILSRISAIPVDAETGDEKPPFPAH